MVCKLSYCGVHVLSVQSRPAWIIVMLVGFFCVLDVIDENFGIIARLVVLF
jgi:hypothetical protein